MNTEKRFQITSGPRPRNEVVAEDPLGAFLVWWDDLSRQDVVSFQQALDEACLEADLQSFLQAKPILLVQHLSGGHGRWVLPQKRLGAEWVTDFVVGERDSLGFHWQVVELESPRVRMFTKAGDPSRHLTHAIRQIQTWRTWLTQNQNYAARPPAQSGLGLTDIMPNAPGLILIGRRGDTPASTNALRRQMAMDAGIAIHSYDYVLDIAKDRLVFTTAQRSKREKRGA